jgi:phosphatidylserine/phosphatidylglycerophosphate/cardiolipin synthase-like enzyme
MPGNAADIGRLTGEFHRLVSAARMSVTCATYNFQPTSKMWKVLTEASEQPGVVVTVYVDGDKGNTDQLKVQMPKVTLYRSGTLPDGKAIVSHAKFVIIDHQLILLTSANFSYSAEKRNIEFGLLLDDPALAASVETTMASKHGSLYELV